MSISLKNYVYRLQNDLQLIAGKLEQGDYEEAIKLCDEWVSSSALFLRPLSSVMYFQCSASLLYLKSQALMAKIKFFKVQSEEEDETLWEELDKTVAFCMQSFFYSGWNYRRKLKPQFDILLADFRYLDEDDYKFKEWLVVCLTALDILKKRQGKKNKLAYAEVLMQVAKTVIDLHSEDSTLTWAVSLLLQSLNIYKKFDPDNTNKIGKIALLLKAVEISSNEEFSIGDLSELLDSRINKLNIDNTSAKSEKLEKEQAFYSHNYLLAIQNLQENRLDDALAYAKHSVEHGKLFLDQLDAEQTIGFMPYQIMQGITIMSIIIFHCEKEENVLKSIIDLWKKFVTEIQSKNRDNKHAYFANMTDEELSANISRKDIMVHLASGVYNYNPLEASLALSAQSHIGICYILLDDIEQGLNCKKEMEKILDFNDDIFDDDIAALITYPMYINLCLYYYRQHQTKEAEQYNQLHIKLRNALSNSEYSNQISIYDQLFEEIYKSVS